MIRVDMWTPEEEAWLREVYPDHLNSRISEMHAERFPDRPRRSERAINSRARVYGLHKREGFDRNQGRRSVWTPEREQWLRDFAPGHDIYEIIDEFERISGERLSKCAMKNAKQRFGAKSHTNIGQFVKGQESYNKGKTWDDMGLSEQARANCRRNQFKKGGIPHNALDKPIGTEREDVYGYVWVKVAERKTDPKSAHDNWKMKHHLVWEQANGQLVPEGHMVVFADHDNQNFSPGNLVLVPRSLWAVISRSHYRYWDAESLEVAMNIAKLDSARYAAQCRPRECKVCGQVFKPRFPHHRTCDACLGR